mmetsp:Transcript_17181/g.32712  ORF Transcript_17181/g.32712 Transcript_17181/m.32712 type:complete len:263 (+) Transcript_17181:360-1148(+)
MRCAPRPRGLYPWPLLSALEPWPFELDPIWHLRVLPRLLASLAVSQAFPPGSTSSSVDDPPRYHHGHDDHGHDDRDYLGHDHACDRDLCDHDPDLCSALFVVENPKVASSFFLPFLLNGSRHVCCGTRCDCDRVRCVAWGHRLPRNVGLGNVPSPEAGMHLGSGLVHTCWPLKGEERGVCHHRHRRAARDFGRVEEVAGSRARHLRFSLLHGGGHFSWRDASPFSSLSYASFSPSSFLSCVTCSEPSSILLSFLFSPFRPGC